MAAWEAFLSELLDQTPEKDFKTSDVVARLRTEGNTLRTVLPEDLGFSLFLLVRLGGNGLRLCFAVPVSVN